MKPSSKLIVLTLFLFLPLLATAVPPNHTDHRGDKTIASTTLPVEIEPKSAIIAGMSTAGEISNRFTSGDTIVYLEGVKNYVLGTEYGNDIWGYIDPEGREYAIAGVQDGVAIINVTDDEVVEVVPFAVDCIWKDMKTMGHYAYVVSEYGWWAPRAGIMVLDLSYLPDSTHYVRSVPTNSGDGFSSHNINIDTVTGYIYVEGDYTEGSSIHIHSIADPENPVYVASFGPPDIHDLMVINDTAYVAAGWNPFWEIYDVTNKYAPELLARVNIPQSGYIHNIWPTDDHKHVVTTEETFEKTVKIWNIEDLNNIFIEGEFLGPNSLAHNVQVKGNRVYTAHYESGVVVTDISNPTNPRIIGQFDTYEGEGHEYNGAWGVFPYTNSGLMFVSNTASHVWVIDEIETVLADTLRVDDMDVYPGESCRIDIFASNTVPIETITIPFGWSGSFDMKFDSISTEGMRTDQFQMVTLPSVDQVGNKAIAYLRAAYGGYAPPLPAGEGPILSIYFTVPDTALSGQITLDLSSHTNTLPTFTHRSLEIAPTLASGTITLNRCCEGTRGDVNGDGADLDIVDLTCIVDFLFGAGCEQSCEREADINADGAASDIVDLTFVVDYLFGVPPTLKNCAQ